MTTTTVETVLLDPVERDRLKLEFTMLLHAITDGTAAAEELPAMFAKTWK